MAKTGYLYDEIYMQHNTGMGHPERAERLPAIDSQLQKNSFYGDLIRVRPKIADYGPIEAIHTHSYIERVKSEIESGINYLDSMDTVVCDKSFDVALSAVGGCLNMCDTVMANDAQYGFCAVRPPGHHAEKDYAAGFCIFNNIAIAARYLQSEYNIERVGIVDWDVHHGNGTQHSFESDDSVYYISLHQYPHYPGTGAESELGQGQGKGYTMNIPMRSGSDDDTYVTLFREMIVPALEKFEPDIVLVSAGFDAHSSDPLSSIRLSTDAFYQFSCILREIAKKYAKDGHLIAFLEGGYNLNALASGVEAVLKSFIED